MEPQRRAFLLALDADEGQQIAAKHGFLPPSDEVSAREKREVEKLWATMGAEGVLPWIWQYARWFAPVAHDDEHEELTQEQLEVVVSSFFTFAATVLAMLKVNGLVETPPHRRLTPIVVGSDGVPVIDSQIPEELRQLDNELRKGYR